MRVLLVHNPKAGNEEHKAEDLIAALEKAGHKAFYQSSKKKGIGKALKKKLDLVLVAGGDGTVAKLARRLVGKKIPMSVLPLGTANNLARTLGFQLSAETLIKRLEDGRCSGFDIGLARGPWGKRYFFEGTGAGLLADYFHSPRKVKAKDEGKSKKEEVRRHVVELRRQLMHHPAHEWEIFVDDEDLSGRYVLWQAMNIRSVGPVLTLAPEAETSDGKFEFVAAREEEREPLLKYLKVRLTGKEPNFPLPTMTFRRMSIHWEKFPLHFDDEIWPDEDEKRKAKPGNIEVVVKPSALTIWKTA